MHNNFGDVPIFLRGNDLPAVTSGKLLKILDDEAAGRKLKMELATTVDAMEPFVNATYALEGDGPLALAVSAIESSSFSYCDRALS